MSLQRRAWILSGLMLAAAGVSTAMIPRRYLAAQRQGKIADLMPRQFADWRIDTSISGGVVNPQTQQILDRLYSEIVERVYINSQGERVMLTIAYGEDQTDGSVQLHYPEVCYPAQGFQIRGSHDARVTTAQGEIPVRRLFTVLSNQRFEPVTYWTVIGDQQALGGWQRKRAEILHGLRGDIVDGVLFRVSSIDRNEAEGYALQDRFVAAAVAAMSPAARLRLTGLGQGR